jgi:hypothetical protein
MRTSPSIDSKNDNLRSTKTLKSNSKAKIIIDNIYRVFRIGISMTR